MDFDPSEWGSDIFTENGYNEDDTSSEVKPCFYGTECRKLLQGTCNRPHLSVKETPCVYGPNCKTSGCLKAHPEKIFSGCRYKEQCKDLGCRYLHTKDFCRYGSQCKNEKCKFIHPKV